MLQSMGLQWVRHDLVTEQHRFTVCKVISSFCFFLTYEVGIISMPCWIFISHSKSGSAPVFCTFNVMKYLWKFIFKWNLRFEVATVSLRILCKLLKILYRVIARHGTQSDCVLWGQFQNIANVYPSTKSFQSCPTLCDHIDSSPPGFPVPGILQARTLEWVAISFSNAWKWKVKVKLLSRVRLFATPWTAAHQAPPSMGFSRQEYWSGVP